MNKFIRFGLSAVGFVVFLLGNFYDLLFAKLILIPIMYVYVISIRNNETWYFFFEGAIIFSGVLMVLIPSLFFKTFFLALCFLIALAYLITFLLKKYIYSTTS